MATALREEKGQGQSTPEEGSLARRHGEEQAKGPQQNAPRLPWGHPHLQGLPLQVSHWGRVIGYTPGGTFPLPPSTGNAPTAQGEAYTFLAPCHCAHHPLLSLPTPPC